MQDTFVKAEELLDHVKEYVNNRVTAIKLQAAEKSSRIFSNLVAIVVMAAIMLVFVILISLAAAYAINNWIGEDYVGFLVVGVFWLMMALLIWISREKLLRIPVMNKMLHEMFNDEENSKHT